MYENIQENSSMFLFNHICKKKKNNLGYAKFSSGLHKNKKMQCYQLLKAAEILNMTKSLKQIFLKCIIFY